MCRPPWTARAKEARVDIAVWAWTAAFTLTLGVAVLDGPTALVGQEGSAVKSPTEDRATDEKIELREVVRLMVPRLLELEPLAEAEAADRARRRAAELGIRTDTLHVGPFRVVVLDDQRARVEPIVKRALEPFIPWLVGAEHVVEDNLWGVQLYDERESELGIWAPGVRTASSPTSGGSALLAERIVQEVGRLLAESVPEALSAWAGSGPLIPTGYGTTYSMEDLYRAGVISGSTAVSACLDGQADSCWSVLGFPVSDTPPLEWYTSEELRARAIRTVGFRRPRGLAEPTERERELLEALDERLRACMAGDGGSCSWILGSTTDVSPLPRVARTDLLIHALDLGGEGAFGRLVTSESNDVRELIHVAARREADVVVRGWSARVAAARPVVHDDLGTAGAVSLFWVLILGGAAAAGATRRAS